MMRISFVIGRFLFSSLRKLTSLTDLNLSGNHIQVLPQMALSTMENLQVLVLHSNQLRAIPDLRRLNSLKVNFIIEVCEFEMTEICLF